MVQHLALVTTENLPRSNKPCAGGGLRIFGLGESLKRHNINCTYFIHENRKQDIQPSDDLPILFFKPEQLHQAIEQAHCDAVLFEQWQPMTFLKEPLNIPVFVDLPGPLALEYYWLDSDNFYQHIFDKLNALSKADYFFCAHERQKAYYIAWLTWAGLSPECIDRLTVVPFTFHEMPFSRQGHIEDEIQLFWGGVFWPWHDRTKPFTTIVKTLERLRTGQIVIAGALPYEQEGKIFEQYENHNHVSWLGKLNFSEFIPELKRGTVAVDLCKPTQERLLSSDIRTGTALWAGVPVLITPESAWANLVKEHDAGWIIPYDDHKNIITLIEELANNQIDIVAKRRGARAISQIINSNNNVKTLIEWLKNPTKREKSEIILDTRTKDREERLKKLQQQVDELKHRNSEFQHDLDNIRKNPLYKLYKSATHWMKKE